MHVLDDADDAERLALVVVEGLAQRVLLGKQRGRQALADDGDGRHALLVLVAEFDHAGVEGCARGEPDAQRLDAMLIRGVVVSG